MTESKVYRHRCSNSNNSDSESYPKEAVGGKEELTGDERRLGVYIHVPFCRSKCPYCDFYSVRLKYDKGEKRSSKGYPLKAAYIKALSEDIRHFFENREYQPIDTIYFGGGTPNVLEPEDIKKVIDDILEISKNKTNNDKYSDSSDTEKAEFSDSMKGSYNDVSGDVEISLEFNPGIYHDEEELSYLKKLRTAGVNRLSIGVQSFDDRVLKRLGRLHSAGEAEKAVRLAREAGFENLSIDLMFGIPNQSIKIWLDTVKKAISLRPEHISLYSLEYMDGTVLTRMLREGRIEETAPEDDRTMYHKALKLFSEAGYRQYEISNLSYIGEADKDFRSRHNLKYWSLDEYAGFGPSAHSYIDHKRYEINPDIHAYIDNPTARILYEENTLSDDMSEYTFTALRKNEGISLKDFKRRFGMDFWEAFPEAKPELLDFEKNGYVVITQDKIKLTLKGFDISNRILCLFV